VTALVARGPDTGDFNFEAAEVRMQVLADAVGNVDA